MAEMEDRIVISKRKSEGEEGNDDKRLRVETQAALAIVEKQNIARSSTLLAPTMLLTGHQAAVYTLKFDPTGLQLASAGADRSIFLWDTRGECNNYNVLRGHKNVSWVVGVCFGLWTCFPLPTAWVIYLYGTEAGFVYVLECFVLRTTHAAYRAHDEMKCSAV